MPRAPHTLYPMPTGKGQLLLYLQALVDIGEDGFTKSQALKTLPNQVKKEDGEPYGDAMYGGVINSLIKLGFLHNFKSVDKIIFVAPSLFNYINGNYSPNTKSEKAAKLPELSLALFEAMEESEKNDLLDPYISDQLSYMFDAIRKASKDEIWTTKKMLWKIAEKKEVKGKEVDVSPINGFQFLGLEPVGRSKSITEYLRLLSYLGCIEEVEGGWKRCELVKGGISEYIRERFNKLRFEKWLENVLKLIGYNHPVLLNNDKPTNRLFRWIGLYITTRYSGGIGVQRKARKEIINNLNRMMFKINKNHYKIRFPSARPSVKKVDGAEKNLTADALNDLREFRKKMISTVLEDSGWEISKMAEAALRVMDISELENFLDMDYSESEAIDTLLARGAGTYSRLKLNRLCHGGGHFTVPSNFDPYDWQTDCVESWANGDEGGRKPFTGIASAVTGTGKTIMALMAASNFIKSNPKGVVSVVVPSTVLMYQWAEEAAKFIGLDADTIGFCGNNFHDDFSDGRRLVIWIVNSAIKDNRMQEIISKLDSTKPHLLIADECHEYGGEKFRTFLNVRAEGKLAISATPPDETTMGERHPVLNIMGGIFYRLGYREAHAQGLISPFKIRYLGIDLDQDERANHTRLSEDIRSMLREIEEIYGPRIEGGNLIAQLQAIMNEENGGHPVIGRFLQATQERMSLVRNARNRNPASLEILSRITKRSDGFTIMLFHEQINETMRLLGTPSGLVFRQEEKRAKENENVAMENIYEKSRESLNDLRERFLGTSSLRFGMYHSKFPEPWKTWMVEWFRAGRLNVMLSVKALAQGFDMPGADEGIIRTSTSNVRQRIQTIGRLIRKKQEEGSSAKIWIIFVKDTSDERIFTKHDWESELPVYPEGEEEVQTYWEIIEGKLKRIGGAKKLPQPDRELSDEEIQSIDVSGIEFGDDYPDVRVSHNPLHEFTLTRSGSPAVIDGAVPFEIKHEGAEQAAKWLFEQKGKGRILLIANGHFVAWSRTGRMTFLGATDIDSIEKSIKEALEDADNFESFMAGFRKK